MENMDLKPVKDMEKYAYDYIRHVNIFYKRKGHFAECFCSECGGLYVIRTTSTGDMFKDNLARIEVPRKGENTKCRLCNAEGKYMTAGRCMNEWYEANICIGQKISDDKFVFRIYWVNEQIRKSSRATYTFKEFKRVYLEKGKKHVTYETNAYSGQWQKSTVGVWFWCHYHPKAFKEIAKTGMFKYIPVTEEVKRGINCSDWVLDFYKAAARYPDLEMIIKLGMYKLAIALITRLAINFNPRGREIHDRLRIYKNRLPEMVKKNGSTTDLKLYQIEKKTGKHWNSEEFDVVETIYGYSYPGEFEILTKYTSPMKLKNYMEKQGIWYGMKNSWELRHEYIDYLRMREQEGYDMTNEIILFPKDIRRRHNEMVRQTEKKKIDKRRAEVLEKYPKISKDYKRLSNKYSAAAAGYLIRPAKDAAEIVDEGRILHHCVGGDNYLRSHSSGNTTILFLRKADKPDKPFITVEIRGETIVQWYGAYDKKPQKAYFEGWLNTYVEELSKRKPKK